MTSATVTPPRADVPPLRLPPHNHDAEIQLLGAILNNNRAYQKVAAFLLPTHFADHTHGRIFDACGKLIERGQIADPITLKNYFEQDASLAEFGGAAHLAKIAGACATVINAAEHGRIVHDLAIRRDMLNRLEDAAERIRNVDVDETAATIAVDLAGDMERMASDRSTAFRTARQVREQIAESLNKPINCDSTGIRCLDEMLLGGLHAGKAIGLMGRRKSGKTLLAGEVSANLSRAGIKHAYVACEMGSSQIEQRSLAAEIGVNSAAFLSERNRENTSFVSRVGQAAIAPRDAGLYVDAAGVTFAKLRRIVTEAVLTHRVRGVIVDYLQLIGGQTKGQSRVEHLETVAQWLADTAARRGIWVLCLGQINMEGNVRHGEGILLAFDHVFEIRRDQAGEGNCAWLETIVSRYTTGQGAGKEDEPVLRLDKDCGPRFVEIGA